MAFKVVFIAHAPDADPDYSTKLLREMSPIIFYGIFGRPGK